MILTEPRVRLDVLEARTGWSIKPQGACKGEVCIPLPPDSGAGATSDANSNANADAEGTVDALALAERLGMPVLHDEAHGLWAIGPETAITGRALSTATLPDIELPDIDGNPFRLGDLRGQKVLLVAWASW
jgi:hypothetical protein